MIYDRPHIEQERIIHPLWLWSAAGALLAALLARQGALFLGASLLLCAELVSYVWGRRALTAVTYHRVLSRRRAAWGETLTLRIEIENRKLLPLPWLRIADEVPAALELSARLSPTHRQDRRILRNLMAVLWYQRVTKRYQMVCAERGEHVFGPAELRAGDIFGLSTARLVDETRDTVLVHPKVVPLGALGLPATQPFGELRAPQRLFEDPLRTIGVRDYTPGDSLRHMHWKATARAGAPQVRVYEPVRTLRALLFLDVATSAKLWLGYDADLLELAIVTAASTALHLIGQGYDVGLYTNGRALLHEGLVHVVPGRAPATATAILDALGRLNVMAAAPLERVMAHVQPRLPLHSSAIVVSAAPTAALGAALQDLRAEGRAAALLCIGDACQAPSLPGVTVRHIGGERAWRALPALELR